MRFRVELSGFARFPWNEELSSPNLECVLRTLALTLSLTLTR